MLKKSQASVLIAISALVVIGALFIYTQANTDSTPIIDDSPEEPVYNFVRSCMEKETKKGMEKIGEHGGWLYPPENIRYADRDTYNRMVKNKQGLKFFGTKYPYWYYYDDSNEEFKTNIPPFEDPQNPNSIKSQLQKYINQNIEEDCIQSFSEFDDQYDIEYNPRNLQTEVEFEDDKIIVNLKLNLNVRNINTNKTFFYNDFRIEKFNAMKRPYYHALTIVKSEINNSFIDHRAWQLLRPYQTSDNRKELPPTSDFKLDYDMKPWDLTNSKKLIKKILETNLNYVTFEHSRNNAPKVPTELKNNQLAQGIYNLYHKNYISEGKENVENLNEDLLSSFKKDDVKIIYQQFFPLYFGLDGSVGNMVYMPDATSFMKGILPFFWTEYQTGYKLTGPVLIDITSHYPNIEYNLKVPVEFNIRHNEPLSQNIKTDLNMEKYKLPETGGSAKSLTCNPSQFVSKPVYFNLTDPVKKSGIEDAIIMFNCKNMTECYVGETKKGFKAPKSKYNDEMEKVDKSYFEAQLPVNCKPGSLKIFKKGYKTVKINNVNPSLSNSIDLGEIKMPSSKKLEVKIKKAIYNKDDQYEQFRENESAIIMFNHQEDKNFVRVAKVNESSRNGSVKLIPGKYNIRAFLIQDKEMVIKAEKKEVKNNMDKNNITMNTTVNGGANIHGWNLNTDILRNSDQLIIPIIDIGEKPETMMGMEDYGKALEKAMKKEASEGDSDLQPKLK